MGRKFRKKGNFEPDVADVLAWSMYLDGYLNGGEITPEMMVEIRKLEKKLGDDFFACAREYK